MQASKNFSDTWLSHWIMSMNSPNTTIKYPVDSNIPILYVNKIKYNVICMIEKLMTWHKFTGCESVKNSTFRIEESQTASNNFYLFIYIGIAIFNSAIALIRAFAFAFGGIKAAKFIHDRLLNSVFSVSFSFFIAAKYVFLARNIMIKRSFFRLSSPSSILHHWVVY